MPSFADSRWWSSWRGILTASQAWAWISVGLSVLVCATIAALHLDHRHTLNQTVSGLDNIRLARLDLAQGLLHILMSQHGPTPFDRGQGLALMRQSVDSFENETAAMARSDAVVKKFREAVSGLRKLLTSLNLQTPLTPDHAVRLRIAVHQVEQLANQLDEATRSELHRLSARLDTVFKGTLGGSALLLTGVGTAVFLADRARRNAEKERWQSAELLRSVAEGTTDAIFVKDREGRYLLINPAGCRFVGLTADQVLGRDDTPLFNADHARLVMDRDQTVMTTGVAHTWEEELTAAGVTRTYLATKSPLFDECGRVIGVMGISRDISERKRAEEALKASEERLRRVLDALPVAAYTCDADGLITYFNAQAVKAWGQTPVAGDPGNRFCGSFKLYTVNHEPVPHSECWMAVALRERRSVSGREIIIERPDGSRRFVLAHANPLLGASGSLYGAVNVLEDITERRQTEERLARQQTELLHVSRLSTVGQMVAALSHEVAQPLTAISNFAAASQTLLDGSGEAPAELREYVAEINRQSQRAGTILQHLRDYSRKSPVRHAVCDLNEVVRDSVALTASEFRRRQVRIDWNSEAATLTTEGDRIQLQQVVVNLLTNAADAMQNLEPSERLIRLRTWQDGDTVFAEVSDCGPGISPEHLSRVFDPFFTTKANGMGIGLSICRTIVNDHGGSIETAGNQACGATFQVRLPLLRYAHAG